MGDWLGGCHAGLCTWMAAEKQERLVEESGYHYCSHSRVHYASPLGKRLFCNGLICTGDGEDLSSDTADEDFVYSVAADPLDVMLYGEGYASYKARMLHELDGAGDESDDEYNGEDEDPVERFT